MLYKLARLHSDGITFEWIGSYETEETARTAAKTEILKYHEKEPLWHDFRQEFAPNRVIIGQYEWIGPYTFSIVQFR